MKKEFEEGLKSNDLEYCLLAKLPNGDIHAVMVDPKELERMISSLPHSHIKLLKRKIEGLTWHSNNPNKQ